MSTIRAILETHHDGTLHLPVPPELRHGKIAVTATLRLTSGSASKTPHATPDMLQRRREALQHLRALGGLGNAIPDPVAWQKEQRQDRPLPGRD